MSFNQYRYLIFAVLGAAYVLVFFHRLAPAVVAVDMMTDLKAGGALMGLLASAYFYPYALMQIPAGILSDSWGPRRSMVIFFFLAAIGSILLGLAQTVSMAMAARILVGLGVAMVFVPTLKIMTRWFESDRYVHMSGYLMSLGGVGAYIASTPLALMSDAITWRGSMIVIGILTLIVSGLVWVIVRDNPQQKGYAPIPDPAHDGLSPRIGILASLWLVIRSPRFWPVALVAFFGAGVLLSFSGLWGGPFLMHVHGLTRSEAGGVLAMMALGIILGAPTMSWLANHVFHSRKKVLLISQLGAFLVFAPLALFPAEFPRGALYIWFFLFSFISSSLVVVGYPAIKDSFPLQISGTASGILNIFPFAGAALGQPLIGWYLDSIGPAGGPYSPEAYSSAFTLCLVSLFLALIAGTQVKETHPGALAPRG